MDGMGVTQSGRVEAVRKAVVPNPEIDRLGTCARTATFSDLHAAEKSQAREKGVWDAAMQCNQGKGRRHVHGVQCGSCFGQPYERREMRPLDSPITRGV